MTNLTRQGKGEADSTVKPWFSSLYDMLVSEISSLVRGMNLEKEGKCAPLCYSSTFSESSKWKCWVSRWIYRSEVWEGTRTEPWEIATCVIWAEETQQARKAHWRGSSWIGPRVSEPSPGSISTRKGAWHSAATAWPSQTDWKALLGLSNWRGYWGMESGSSRLSGVEGTGQWSENWAWSGYLEALSIDCSSQKLV